MSIKFVESTIGHIKYALATAKQVEDGPTREEYKLPHTKTILHAAVISAFEDVYELWLDVDEEDWGTMKGVKDVLDYACTQEQGNGDDAMIISYYRFILKAVLPHLENFAAVLRKKKGGDGTHSATSPVAGRGGRH